MDLDFDARIDCVANICRTMLMTLTAKGPLRPFAWRLADFALTFGN